MSNIKLWPFRRSEHEQFEDLIRPHLKQLYKLAFRLTGQHFDAEDIIQDVLVKIYPRLSEMQKIEKLAPWLSRIVYRHFIDKLRSQQRSPVEYDGQSLYDNHPSINLQPRQLFENDSLQDSLHDALMQLNPVQRILVLLHDVEGYTLDEIQKMQDVPVGTLKSRLSRSRQKLRNILIQAEPFEDNRRVNG